MPDWVGAVVTPVVAASRPLEGDAAPRHIVSPTDAARGLLRPGGR